MRHDVFEEADGNFKLTERLDVIVHVNLALFDLIALFLEFVGDIGVGHRSVKRIVLAGLPANDELQLSRSVP